MLYETEKNIKENDDKLADEDKSLLNEKLDSLKKAKDSGNVSDMKKALEELNNAWSQIAPKLYQSLSNRHQVRLIPLSLLRKEKTRMRSKTLILR